MRARTTVNGNTADQGGGIWNGCGATALGTVADINVVNNHPDNIFDGSCG